MSSVFTNEFLDSLSDKADPVLDELVNEAAEQLDGITTMTTLFRRVIGSPRLTGHALGKLRDEGLITESIVHFFRSMDDIPSLPWLDKEQIHAGGTFYRDRGVLGFVTLACASLPACYCMSGEAYQLGCTGRLQQPAEVPRRIPETANFVLDIVTKHAFDRGGIGFHSSHKVRLMHSIIRYFIITKQAAIAEGNNSPVERRRISDQTHIVFGHDWTKDRGPPIAQELMIATMLTFSYVVLKGFDRMGVQVTEAERSAYLHRWNFVGYLLGVDERVLASINTMEDAETMFNLIMERKRKTSEDGKTLESALLLYMQQNIIGRVTGGRHNPMIVVPKILTRQLAGKSTADAISLELGLVGGILRFPVWWFTKIAGHLSNSKHMRWLTSRLMAYLTSIIWDWRADGPDDPGKLESDHIAPVSGRGRQEVIVPTELAREWNVKRN